MHSTSREDCEELQCPACEKQGCYFNNISAEDYPEGLVEGISISLLDLINRQQAEIERLNGISDRLNDICTKQDLEIERLKAEIEETNEADREAEVQALSESKENAKLFCEAINHAKSEAVKEFAERLKGKFLGEYKTPRAVIKGRIDNLVKEMTEQSTGYGSSKTEGSK